MFVSICDWLAFYDFPRPKPSILNSTRKVHTIQWNAESPFGQLPRYHYLPVIDRFPVFSSAIKCHARAAIRNESSGQVLGSCLLFLLSELEFRKPQS